MRTAKWSAILLIFLTFPAVPPGSPQASNPHRHEATSSSWSAWMDSMKRMHATMTGVEESAKSHVDFVRLMLPHHQAAIDMAKTELLYATDPQMRRLAQEIIADQESEIE